MSAASVPSSTLTPAPSAHGVDDNQIAEVASAVDVELRCNAVVQAPAGSRCADLGRKTSFCTGTGMHSIHYTRTCWRSLCVLSCPDADAQANAGDGSAERPLDFDQTRAYIDGAWRRRTGLPSWRETVFACAFVPACAACRTQVRVTTVYCLRRISFATAGEGCASPTPSLWCGVTLVRDRVARRVVGLLLACPGPGRAWRGRRVLLGSHAGCAWGNLARRHGASPGRFASTRMRDKMTNRLVQVQGCVHFTRAC